VSGKLPAIPSSRTAKTRYRQADAPCTLARVAAGEMAVDFSAPQWAVTPGQSVVLYDREICLGGGIIT
jgi:tRNA-specific 2-thiouridylase